jgi:S1-C subfamily serine protease
MAFHRRVAAFFFGGLIGLALLAGGVAPAQNPSPEIITRLQHATVYIESTLVLSGADWAKLPEQDRQKIGRRPQGEASGSGFIVSPEGYIITNAHVVSEARERVIVGKPQEGKFLDLHYLPTALKVVVNSGQADEKSYVPKLVKVDQNMDLALLKIDCGEPLTALALRPAKAGQGQAIFLAGFPGGKVPDQAPFVESAKDFNNEKNPRVSINGGMITAVRQSDKNVRYQLDARANHGNSGGPVVNPTGEVVGVLYAGIDELQSINYAIPTRYLSRVLPSDMRKDWAAEEGDTGGDQSFNEFEKSGSFKLK